MRLPIKHQLLKQSHKQASGVRALFPYIHQQRNPTLQVEATTSQLNQANLLEYIQTQGNQWLLESRNTGSWQDQRRRLTSDSQFFDHQKSNSARSSACASVRKSTSLLPHPLSSYISQPHNKQRGGKRISLTLRATRLFFRQWHLGSLKTQEHMLQKREHRKNSVGLDTFGKFRVTMGLTRARLIFRPQMW